MQLEEEEEEAEEEDVIGRRDRPIAQANLLKLLRFPISGERGNPKTLCDFAGERPPPPARPEKRFKITTISNFGHVRRLKKHSEAERESDSPTRPIDQGGFFIITTIPNFGRVRIPTNVPRLLGRAHRPRAQSNLLKLLRFPILGECVGGMTVIPRPTAVAFGGMSEVSTTRYSAMRIAPHNRPNQT